MSPWCLLRESCRGSQNCGSHQIWKHNVHESSHWTVQKDEPGILFSSKARGLLAHGIESQENAPEGGDQMTPDEEIPVENNSRNQVSTLVRHSILDSESSNLWPAKLLSEVHELAWKRVLSFMTNSNWNRIYLLSQLYFAGGLCGNDSISYICHVDQWLIL